jgi:hypothetical protein
METHRVSPHFGGRLFIGMLFIIVRHTPQMQAFPDTLIESFASYPDTMWSK